MGIPEVETLTSVTLPESVTRIGNEAFSGRLKAEFTSDLSHVTEFGAYAFAMCCQLDDLVINETVTELPEYVFAYCSGLTTLVIPDSVTTIGVLAFYECTGLEEVTIPADVEYMGLGSTEQNVGTAPTTSSIGNCTFAGCANVKKITYTPGKTGISD